MISYQEFGKLRLSQFIAEQDISALKDWKFMGNNWIGEAVGFSEWLRPKANPDTLLSLAIDFSQLPKKVCNTILERIQLPLSKGMTEEELHSLVGPPYKIVVFREDRQSLSFRFGSPEYNLSCTVLNEGGLTYLVVMAPY